MGNDEQEKRAEEPEEEEADVAEAGDDEGGDDDDEERPSVEEEFRALYGEAEAESRRLKGLAMKAEQGGDPAAATVLREVAGGVLQLLQELIATCGGAFQDLEGLIEDAPGSHLDVEDAEKLHGLLLACRKLASEVLSAGATGESRTGLETLMKLIDDQMSFVLDVSEYQAETPAASN